MTSIPRPGAAPPPVSTTQTNPATGHPRDRQDAFVRTPPASWRAYMPTVENCADALRRLGPGSVSCASTAWDYVAGSRLFANPELYRAKDCMAQGQYAQAANLLSRLLKQKAALRPATFKSATLLMAEAHARQGKYATARVLVDNLLNGDGLMKQEERASLNMIAGNHAIHQGAWKLAAHYFEQAAAAAPAVADTVASAKGDTATRARAHASASLAYYCNGDIAKALAAANTALAISPSDRARLILSLSRLLYCRLTPAQVNESRRALEEVFANNWHQGDEMDPYIALLQADSHCTNGTQAAEIFAMLARVEAVCPNLPLTAIIKGINHWTLGQTDQATQQIAPLCAEFRPHPQAAVLSAILKAETDPARSWIDLKTATDDGYLGAGAMQILFRMNRSLASPVEALLHPPAPGAANAPFNPTENAMAHPTEDAIAYEHALEAFGIYDVYRMTDTAASQAFQTAVAESMNATNAAALTRAFIAAGQWDKAKACLEAAQQLDLNVSFLAYENVLVSYQTAPDPQARAAALGMISNTNNLARPQDCALLALRGQLKYLNGDLPGALQDLQMLEQHSVIDANTDLALGNTYYELARGTDGVPAQRLGLATQARAHFQLHIDHAGVDVDPEVYERFIECCIMMGEVPRGKARLPYVKHSAVRANLRHRLDNLTPARALTPDDVARAPSAERPNMAFSLAAQRDMKDAASLLLLGKAYAEQGKKAEARAKFEAARRHAPREECQLNADIQAALSKAHAWSLKPFHSRGWWEGDPRLTGDVAPRPQPDGVAAPAPTPAAAAL